MNRVKLLCVFTCFISILMLISPQVFLLITSAKGRDLHRLNMTLGFIIEHHSRYFQYKVVRIVEKGLESEGC